MNNYLLRVEVMYSSSTCKIYINVANKRIKHSMQWQHLVLFFSYASMQSTIWKQQKKITNNTQPHQRKEQQYKLCNTFLHRTRIYLDIAQHTSLYAVNVLLNYFMVQKKKKNE